MSSKRRGSVGRKQEPEPEAASPWAAVERGDTITIRSKTNAKMEITGEVEEIQKDAAWEDIWIFRWSDMQRSSGNWELVSREPAKGNV